MILFLVWWHFPRVPKHTFSAWFPLRSPGLVLPTDWPSHPSCMIHIKKSVHAPWGSLCGGMAMWRNHQHCQPVQWWPLASFTCCLHVGWCWKSNNPPKHNNKPEALNNNIEFYNITGVLQSWVLIKKKIPVTRWHIAEWHRKSELMGRYLTDAQCQELQGHCDGCMTHYIALSNLAMANNELLFPFRPKLHAT